jgi:hypothetical protein
MSDQQPSGRGPGRPPKHQGSDSKETPTIVLEATQRVPGSIQAIVSGFHCCAKCACATHSKSVDDFLCHRFPPAQGPFGVLFPAVRADDWCMEFKG